MAEGRNRIFHYAVLASLALHALLFVAFPDLVDSARRAASIPPQIIARLLEPEPPAPVIQQPAPVAPREEPRPKKPEAKKPEAKKPQLVTPRTETPVVTEAPSAPGPVPAPAIPAPPPVAAVEPQPSQTAPQSAPAPETITRDQYRVQLLDEARRHKRYPPLARENNWQGDVLVGVIVGANGRASVTLKGSSGYEVLDRQALDMFRQAARAVPVPPTLRGKEFALEVRAVYGLED